MEHTEIATGKLAGKYLTFGLGNEQYGIRIMQIKEIIGMLPITSVPQVPAHVKGVINLRGKVIPVTDLRLRFGLEEAPYTERTCIIVVESVSAGFVRPIGVVVDAVSEVLNIKPEEMEPPPAFDGSVTIDFILGLAKCAGGGQNPARYRPGAG